MSIATVQSPYHLSEEQLNFFDQNGYVLLKNWIPQDLLKRLQDASNTWIHNGLTASDNDPLAIDYKYAKRGDKNVFWRVDYVHNKGNRFPWNCWAVRMF